MKKDVLAYWMTDIHMNFLVNAGVKRKFLQKVEKCKAPIFITGDIGDGRTLSTNLKELATASEFPVYFVTGNHDYYHSSFERTEDIIRMSVQEFPNLVYLPVSGLVPLTEDTCIIGPESWADGKVVPFVETYPFCMNDFVHIADLKDVDKRKVVKTFQKRASDGVEALKSCLDQARLKYKKIIIMSHAVPFGRLTTPSDYQPFYVWYEGGTTICDFCDANPEIEVLWLSGHTHCPSSFKRDKLNAYVLGSEYCFPQIGAEIHKDLSVKYLLTRAYE